jgi:addiction module HigA family antidote
MASIRSKARKPTHPGEILREDVLPELGITQGELAEKLGVSRRTVSEILHARRPVTPDMAIRIGRLCGNGPDIWLRMQAALDLWQLERSNANSYRRIPVHRKAA